MATIAEANESIGRVLKVSDDDWRVVVKKVKNHLRIRKILFSTTGVHSEKNFGMSPMDYYLGNAIEKLFDGKWIWKKDLTISEQVIRIIDSMISTELEKADTDKAKSVNIEYVDADKDLWLFPSDIDISQSDEIEKDFQEKIDLIYKAIDGDNDLELLFLCIQQGIKSKDIAEEMGIPVERVYKLSEKLKLKANKLKRG